MEQERNIDKLAKHIINIGAFAIIAFLCWYFRSVLIDTKTFSKAV